jgi:uncharacterized damage-inducible protein DinB
MSIAQSLIPEFTHEFATTRSLLERVPFDRASWAPHAKSTSLGELAAHLADLASLVATTVRQTELDLEPRVKGSPAPAMPGSTHALLSRFDDGVRLGLQALEGTSDDAMRSMWSLKRGGETVLVLPRVAILRTVVMNHLIHHRGQLSVYLRMSDVPLPPIYGPTADEPHPPRR